MSSISRMLGTVLAQAENPKSLRLNSALPEADVVESIRMAMDHMDGCAERNTALTEVVRAFVTAVDKDVILTKPSTRTELMDLLATAHAALAV